MRGRESQRERYIELFDVRRSTWERICFGGTARTRHGSTTASVNKNRGVKAPRYGAVTDLGNGLLGENVHRSEDFPTSQLVGSDKVQGVTNIDRYPYCSSKSLRHLSIKRISWATCF